MPMSCLCFGFGVVTLVVCLVRGLQPLGRPLPCRVPVDVPFPAWRAKVSCHVFSCSADGNYEVTLMTKATVYYTGLVVWQPPAVYKSSCAIDVEFFPYDVQTCVLKLGSWTYDGFKVTISSRSVECCLVCSCLENCRALPVHNDCLHLGKV